MAAALSPEDRAVVDEAVDEIRDGPRPRDRGPLGCALALPGFAILLVMPVVARRLGLPDAVGVVSLALGAVLMVVGLVVYFTAGGFVRGHYHAAAEAALRGLEAWDPQTDDREEALRGATLLLLNAVAVYGPTSSMAFDPVDARRRLDTVLPLVEAVEAYLVAGQRSYRVFTEGDDVNSDRDAGRG